MSTNNVTIRNGVDQILRTSMSWNASSSAQLVDSTPIVSMHIIGFLDIIKSVQPSGRWKLVVVDSLSLKILNSACKMYDILEENVSARVVWRDETQVYGHPI